MSDRAELGELLREQIRALDDFAATLDEEQRALRGRNAAALSVAVDHKLSALQRADRLGSRLFGLLQARGQSGDEAGLTALADTPELRELCRTLRKRLEDCNHHNQVNGGIIQVNKACSEQLLDILKGNHDRPRLYGAKGGIDRSNNLGSLARA